MKNLILSFALTLTISFTITAQVSITTTGTAPDSSAMLDVNSTERGFAMPRMTQAQRIAILNPVPCLQVYQTTGNKGIYYFDGVSWVRIGVNTGHFIGEPFAGGIIAYVDETGNHGIICSMVDVSTPTPWSNVTDTEVGITAQSLWDGIGNSTATVNQSQHMTSAAKQCLDYVNAFYGTGIFTNWYLPSNGEARLLWSNSYQVQKVLETDANPLTIPISDGPYWTSTEYNDSTACGFSIIDRPAYDNIMLDGVGQFKSDSLLVRCFRAF